MKSVVIGHDESGEMATLDESDWQSIGRPVLRVVCTVAVTLLLALLAS